MVCLSTQQSYFDLKNISESVIDRVLHPELRDRMILLRGQFAHVAALVTDISVQRDMTWLIYWWKSDQLSRFMGTTFLPTRTGN
jgi:hypothetical protein